MSAPALAGFAAAWALFHDVMPRASGDSPEAVARAVEDAGIRASVALPLVDGLDSGKSDALRVEAERTLDALHSVLLDQRTVAGVGNIYANEALFDARLRPSRRTHKLSLEEFARLHAAIVDVLQRALASSGTTLRDYRTGTGERGRFQFALRVYGRGGEKCVNCGRKLVMTHQIDLRQTVFCRRCQR